MVSKRVLLLTIHRLVTRLAQWPLMNYSHIKVKEWWDTTLQTMACLMAPGTKKKKKKKIIRQFSPHLSCFINSYHTLRWVVWIFRRHKAVHVTNSKVHKETHCQNYKTQQMTPWSHSTGSEQTFKNIQKLIINYWIRKASLSSNYCRHDDFHLL